MSYVQTWLCSTVQEILPVIFSFAYIVLRACELRRIMYPISQCLILRVLSAIYAYRHAPNASRYGCELCDMGGIRKVM